MKQKLGWMVPAILIAAAFLIANTGSAQAGGIKAFSFSSGDTSSAESGASVSATRVMIARVGNPSIRPTSGLTPDASPARQIEKASVIQNIQAGRIGGTVTLRGVPSEATLANLVIEFGKQEGTVCQGEEAVSARTVDSGSPNATYDGRTITLDRLESDARSEEWDCAFVVLTEFGDSSVAYDALIGPLRQVLEPPYAQLKVKMKKELTLKPGRSAKVKVTVKNTGTGPVGRVNAKLNTKKLKVNQARLKFGKIPAGKSRSKTVKVKLTSRKPGKLTVLAGGGKIGARGVLKVSPPVKVRKGRAGFYESPDTSNSVSLEITKSGHIQGFRIFLGVQCGIFPDIPTTQYTWYDFPKTKIPPNGKVDAQDKGELYTANLEATIVGTRIKDGYFSYNGPNFCFGSDRWTARKVK